MLTAAAVRRGARARVGSVTVSAQRREHATAASSSMDMGMVSTSSTTTTTTPKTPFPSASTSTSISTSTTTTTTTTTPKHHHLEKTLPPLPAVEARRAMLSEFYHPENNPANATTPSFARGISKIPLTHLPDTFYPTTVNRNCESVVGFVPLPIGVVGPLTVNNRLYPAVPLATTEGALVASTNRGARAAGNITARVVRDAMTRAPVVMLPTLADASEFARFVEDPAKFAELASWFSETTRFGRLQSVRAFVVGRRVHLRFSASTGDAMGMNLVGKAVERVLMHLLEEWSRGGAPVKLVSLSSNACMDKKAGAMNWIEGRGKSVVAEAVVREDVVRSVLKTNAKDIVAVNTDKNLVGSAVAGAVGGFNAHAANVVAAVFIATGQDPAQVVESSSCLTFLETCGANDADLRISVTMPSLEVGTVGGGTHLPAQAACLEMLGVAGPSVLAPGDNAKRLAEVIASVVLAGELSLLAALSTGDLITAHEKLNRGSSSSSAASASSSSAAPTSGTSIVSGKRTSHAHIAPTAPHAARGMFGASAMGKSGSHHARTTGGMSTNDYRRLESASDDRVHERFTSLLNEVPGLVDRLMDMDEGPPLDEPRLPVP